MRTRRIFGAAVVAASAVLGVMACRAGDPSGEPKTAPNSPIPKIEGTEDPKPGPSLSGDAG